MISTKQIIEPHSTKPHKHYSDTAKLSDTVTFKGGLLSATFLLEGFFLSKKQVSGARRVTFLIGFKRYSICKNIKTLSGLLRAVVIPLISAPAFFFCDLVLSVMCRVAHRVVFRVLFIVNAKQYVSTFVLIGAAVC